MAALHIDVFSINKIVSLILFIADQGGFDAPKFNTRMTFHPLHELPLMREWYNTEGESGTPSESSFKTLLKELNSGHIRKERKKITLSKLKNWWKNERQRLKRKRLQGGDKTDSSPDSKTSRLRSHSEDSRTAYSLLDLSYSPTAKELCPGVDIGSEVEVPNAVERTNCSPLSPALTYNISPPNVVMSPTNRSEDERDRVSSSQDGFVPFRARFDAPAVVTLPETSYHGFMPAVQVRNDIMLSSTYSPMDGQGMMSPGHGE